MRKVFCCIALLTVLLSCNEMAKKDSSTLPKNTERTWDNLKGNVKMLTEETYKVDSITGAIGKKDSVYYEVSYDEKGYQLNAKEKDSTGKTTFQYDRHRREDGSWKEISTKKNGKEIFKLLTEVDSMGKYVSGKTFDSTGKQDGYYIDLKTSDYGIVYSGKKFKMSGKPEFTFDAKYEKGTLVKSSETDSTGRVTATSSVKLNDKGDPSETTNVTVGKDSTTTKVTTYKYDKYDETGNWTQRISYEKGKPIAITKRAFTYYKD